MNSPTSQPAPRFGRLLACYPSPADPTALREISALRRLGFTIETATLRLPDSSLPLTPEEAAESAATFTVLPRPTLLTFPRIVAHNLFTLLRMQFTCPLVVLRAHIAAATSAGANIAQFFHAWLNVMDGLLLADWLRRRSLTHLHIDGAGYIATTGRIAARALRIPYSLTVHGPQELFTPRRHILRKKLTEASFVLAGSQSARSQLMRLAPPSAWNRILLAPSGVDAAFYAARTPRAIAVPVQMLTLTPLVPHAGLPVLLQAAAILARRGHPLHITIAGSGPDAALLRSIAVSHGIADSVHFSGPVTAAQQRDLLAEADVLVVPSLADTLPPAIATAMSTQLVVVATWAGGAPELITHNVDGILVPPGNPEALADALEPLLSDAALRARLGLAARRRVLDSCDSATALNTTAAIIRSALSSQ